MKWVHLLILQSIFCAAPAHSDEDLPSKKSFEELLKEQRLDEAIHAFLAILPDQKKSEAPAPESSQFAEAYEIYLNLQGKPAQENAIAILSQYGKNTDDPNLAYLLAASYANLGRFDQFFPLYLTGYRNNPDHYLADKMIAVLHIKLFERLVPGEQKEAERKEILTRLQTALAKKKSDHMLYKMILAFSSEKDKGSLTDTVITEMIREMVVYPRADLQFYVRMALVAGNRTLAQRFIDYSRTIFGYSRSLEAAQKLLDSKE